MSLTGSDTITKNFLDSKRKVSIDKIKQEELIKLVNVIMNNETMVIETRTKERLVKFYQYSLKQLSRMREK